MRPKRFLLGLLVAATLGYPVWIHSGPRRGDDNPYVTITKLPTDRQKSGKLVFEAAWELDGTMGYFGGFSALATLPGDRFLAASDAGRRVVFPRPDFGPSTGVFRTFGLPSENKAGMDIEAITRDPATGTLWAALEGRNAIIRFDRRFRAEETAQPKAIRDWGANTGPEAFTRLADGRFLAIEEQAKSWRSDRHRAVIFAGDPVAGAKARRIEFLAPRGYLPVDLAPLGNGRALILFRRLRWAWLPGFDTAIGTIDVDRLSPDGTLRSGMLSRLGGPIPSDNYEGIAITRDPDGRHIWLISDDNFMQLQRSLLLKFRWPEDEEARE